MRFTRLRLSGFKSFVDPTELHIEPGLTGIVGPNGCGKSNLLEALRWVMGENRPTSMRGSGMDDVIFAGAGSRPMRNNAEVSLVVDNADRGAPAPYNEAEALEIARRIERDAGSVYRINGREVRQRDVQIFFADASTGSASPALVRQGQISVLINQKPLARRAILEEAAGISGLHQRRHEAELRLKGAETNLSRLNDVITEIETQLQGLKRQARQASRYRNLSGIIHKVEALVFHLRWRDLDGAANAARAAFAEALQRVQERSETAARASTEQADAAAALPPLRDNEAAMSAALQRLIHERASLDAEETRAREEMQRLRMRISVTDQDRAREQGLEQDAVSALADLGAEREELQAANANAGTAITGAEARASELAGALQQCDRYVERLTAELADLNAKRASYQRTHASGTAQMERAARDRETILERVKVAEAEAAAAPDVQSAEARVEAARAELAAAREAASATETGLDEARTAESAARAPLVAAEEEERRLSADIRAIANLLGKAEHDLWPPVIDSLKVQPGYEAALAAALGDDLDAPLDEAAPHHWRDLGMLENVPPLPAGAPLANFVAAPPALLRRLSYVGVVFPDQGREAQKALLPGQRLVSPRGDLWRWDGYSASSEAPSPAALRLQQRNQLEALERQFEAAKIVRRDADTVFGDAKRRAAEAADANRAAEREARAKNDALIARQDEAARTQRQAAERAAKFATLESQLKSVDTAIDAASRSAQDAWTQLEALPDGVEIAAGLAAAKETAADARTHTSEARANLETLRREALARSQRLTAIASDIQRWTQRREQAEKQILALTERAGTMNGELAALEHVPATIAEKRSRLLDLIGAADAKRAEASDARATAENRLAEADKLAKSANQALTESREERAACEARAESATTRLAELIARIRDELTATPEELPARAEVTEGAELPPLEQAEKRVEKLKAEREQLGGVNLRAEEEAQEQEQRLHTLIADRGDLEGAIERLRRGIQTLNKEGRERLRESFDKVNSNFERLFKELFQGGEARLTFTESEDPLEAGLEILAKPPGKKLATLSLLSGGEQALTAIALIFAVFLVNPAPICVLDEVDAPLDDANVDRFCRLLEEMTKMSETRFLVITHHALTMSRMDRLFGVTMAERGVSQLVSVSLQEAERVVAAE